MENLSGLAANPQSSRTPAPLALRVGFWICIAIAVAVVLRRLVALAHPSTSGPPQLSGLDASFESHAMLTVAHIVPALVFVLLVPLYFSRRFASTVWLERLLFLLGTIVGITAYAMSVACALTFIQFALTHAPKALALPKPVYGLSLVMATVSTVLPAWLMSEGLRRIGANQAALVGSIGPVITIVLGYTFLNEPMSVLQVFGAALVLAGVTLVTMKRSAVGPIE